jgi:hypothetical protein
VLRRISGHKREEVRGSWRKYHNEKVNDVYLSPRSSQGRRDEQGCGRREIRI